MGNQPSAIQPEGPLSATGVAGHLASSDPFIKRPFTPPHPLTPTHSTASPSPSSNLPSASESASTPPTPSSVNAWPANFGSHLVAARSVNRGRRARPRTAAAVPPKHVQDMAAHASAAASPIKSGMWGTATEESHTAAAALAAQHVLDAAGAHAAEPAIGAAGRVSAGSSSSCVFAPAEVATVAATCSCAALARAEFDSHDTKPLLTPLSASYRWKFEVHLLHQLYYAGLVEEQVCRHVEILLHQGRSGSMNANLRAAFEWYQSQLVHGQAEMVELARRMRRFASYNIYFCKMMQWDAQWVEISSSTNGNQITKHFKYDSAASLPPFPRAVLAMPCPVHAANAGDQDMTA
ncbi:hypothetical protein AMAG_00225 [Allomyces macrogynus ATCC 38327]|uniref:Uncharacterized protein n=1 Tax=Allomyces macrogynus (strain ATCC 38327) TaxID=578462 RepID=A0A0L0RVX1_ALLM3|nr:hypothetical protein AMAG_00225 [Allomyces macrogynus ATCC 38327]|eukprot:KNE54235.1 hypothetical protein AMAG_00225 [Allomyces macrogynus ATCC 38327]